MTENEAALDPNDTVAQPPLSQIERVTNTFVAPSKTFADIRRSSSWWLPFLVLTIFGYIFAFTALHHVGIDRVVDNAMKSNPKSYEKFQNLPAEQQAAGLKTTKAIMSGAFYAGPVLNLLLTAITAGLLWIGFNFILGGKSSYGAMFAVGMFAWLPSVLKSLFSTAMAFFSDVEGFNISDPVGTNIGFYLGNDSAAWLKSLLGSVDIFTLWILVLMGIGGAIVSNVKTKSGLLLVFGAWLLFVIIKTGWSAATS